MTHILKIFLSSAWCVKGEHKPSHTHTQKQAHTNLSSSGFFLMSSSVLQNSGSFMNSLVRGLVLSASKAAGSWKKDMDGGFGALACCSCGGSKTMEPQPDLPSIVEISCKIILNRRWQSG